MFNVNSTDPSWHSILRNALNSMDQNYLSKLEQSGDWLPGPDKIFNAFSIPLEKTRFILFGESPYPRKQSANGYAFWDAAVHKLWSDTGLSKPVNRATSLRNFIKLLLLTDKLLSEKDLSQPAISVINKKDLIQTLDELFQKLIREGFLLLNATLALQNQSVIKDAKHWEPFIKTILAHLKPHQKSIKLILLGNIAKKIDAMPESNGFKKIHAEHPYNISFIHNAKMRGFFKTFRLLKIS